MLAALVQAQAEGEESGNFGSGWQRYSRYMSRPIIQLYYGTQQSNFVLAYFFFYAFASLRSVLALL